MLYKREYIENNKKLKEENKQLKEELERQNKGIEALIFMSNKTKEENKRLKERIDKAIEFINTFDGINDDDIDGIVEILKGSDKE